MPHQILTTKELATVLGVTSRHVQQLTQDGLLKKKEKTKGYELAETIQSYITYLDSSKKDQPKNVAKLEIQKLRGEADFKTAKAAKAKIELEELQGNMHCSEDVAAMTEDLILFIRSGFMSLPGRVAIDLETCSTAPERSACIKNHIARILDGISSYKYDQDKYVERVRERKGWDLDVD